MIKNCKRCLSIGTMKLLICVEDDEDGVKEFHNLYECTKCHKQEQEIVPEQRKVIGDILANLDIDGGVRLYYKNKRGKLIAMNKDEWVQALIETGSEPGDMLVVKFEQEGSRGE